MNTPFLGGGGGGGMNTPSLGVGLVWDFMGGFYEHSFLGWKEGAGDRVFS